MIHCQFCSKEVTNKTVAKQHEIRCPKNPSKIFTNYKWTLEQKLNWSKKCSETKANNKEWSEERRDAHIARMKEFNTHYWTDETRLKHSSTMINVVKKNPNSYTKNNVSGRVKIYEIESPVGPTTVKGKWELSVAIWLNEHSIKWTNDITPYNYYWNKRWHLYFPDFYLIDDNFLIEVKGYQTDRDLAKWDSVKDKKLVVLKNTEIDNLSRSMEELMKGHRA